MYTINQSETISDAVLNSTGVIGNWDSILTANNFDNWCPDLYAGLTLQIPDTAETNTQNLSLLQTYTANNLSVSDVYVQIAAIFAILETATPIPSSNVLPTVDLRTFYTVRLNETIGDAVMNSTGSIDNWGLILTDNNFSEWIPTLTAGQKILIPTDVNMVLNTYRGLTQYPANNGSVSDIYAQINAIFEELITPDDWILRNGIWDGDGKWRAYGLWKTI